MQRFVSVSRGRTWGVLLPAMTLPFVSALFYFVLFTESAGAQLLYSATKVFELGWPALAVAWLLGQRLPRPALRDRRHRAAVPLGSFVGVMVSALFFALAYGPLAILLADSGPQIRAKVQGLGIAPYYWPFAIFLSVFHSLLEEYYWRWFVYGELRRLVARWPAHLLAGVAFMAHHVVITTQLVSFGWGLVLASCIGVGGVLFSLLYERQGTLVGAWVAHMLVDLAIMTVGYGVVFGALGFGA